MEPCPKCGVLLGMRDLAAGRCPRCDSIVTPILWTNPAPSEGGEAASGIWRGSSEPPLPSRFTPQPFGPEPDSSIDRPYDYPPFEPFAPPPPPAPPKPRRSRTLAILAALIAFTIVLVVAAIVLAMSNNPSVTASPPAMATTDPATQAAGPVATGTISQIDTKTTDPKSTATTRSKTPTAHS